MTIKSQATYVVLGVLANGISLLHHARTGRYLTPVKPTAGLLFMAAYAGVMGLRELSVSGADVLLLGLLLFIGYGGVYRHVRPVQVEAYAGAFSRWSAVVINLFGMTVTALALTT